MLDNFFHFVNKIANIENDKQINKKRKNKSIYKNTEILFKKKTFSTYKF